MRVTNWMISDTVLSNLSRNLRRLEETQTQLSSGKRLNRPSDDPAGVDRALRYRAGLAAGEQYLRNISAGLDWMNATEASLAAATDALQRARELAIQGANGTLSPTERESIAAEIDQILNHELTVANASLRGQRLFAGLKTDANPFTLSPGVPTTVTFGGDNGQMLREIDVDTTVAINANGDAVFTPILTTLISLRDNLRAGNTAAVSGADLGSLDAALDTLQTARAENGAKINRLEGARDRQSQIQVGLTELLSKTEDVDVTTAITEFSRQDMVYRASLGAAAKSLQPSLMDYLR